MPKLPSMGKPAPIPKIRPLEDRLTPLNNLLGMVAPASQGWLSGQAGALQAGSSNRGQTLEIKSCTSYDDLVKSWEKALEWSEGLDSALVTMLASSMSTQFKGEQLWLKIIGPPSCGKTSLMEGLATATKWYFSRDSIRGFHSGWKDKDKEKDVSLAAKVMGKTLGTKDGDTLLKAPNLKQILAEGRALYDRVSRTDYRNDVSNEYTGHRMTWHLAGTKSLREIDDSELGARFLDVVIMDKIDRKFELTVGIRAVMQEFQNMKSLSDGTPESQYPPDLAEAMALSGGYLDFLRSNAEELAEVVEEPREIYKKFAMYGVFTAMMRARFVKGHEDEADREFGIRLGKQLTRLASSTAVVLGKKEVDDEVVHRVHKVMMDTARGITLNITKILARNPQGVEQRALASLMHMNDEKLRMQLKFLRNIEVVSLGDDGKRWKLNGDVAKLYDIVRLP